MRWTKLSDDFTGDCWTLSDAAFRTHVEGLIWSNYRLTDLRLDKDDMRRWAKHPDAAGELVAVGWWRDDGDAYVIIHHGCYQRTREQVLRQQEANQKNARKPRPGRERANLSIDSLSDSLSDSHSEMDGTGRDRHGEGNQQRKWFADEKNDRGYFAAVAADEPTCDPDGNPFDPLDDAEPPW